MAPSKIGDAMKLALVRKEILTYCGDMPRIIQTHGANCLASVSLALGSCFAWTGPTLDEYSLTQQIPGLPPLPRVADLGAELKRIGLDMMHAVPEGELHRTLETIKRQNELLRELAQLQSDRWRGL